MKAALVDVWRQSILSVLYADFEGFQVQDKLISPFEPKSLPFVSLIRQPHNIIDPAATILSSKQPFQSSQLS